MRSLQKRMKECHDEPPSSFAISGGCRQTPPPEFGAVVKFGYARKRALCICCVCYCVVLARKRAVRYRINNAKHVRAQAHDVCRVLFVCMASGASRVY